MPYMCMYMDICTYVAPGVASAAPEALVERHTPRTTLYFSFAEESANRDDGLLDLLAYCCLDPLQGFLLVTFLTLARGDRGAALCPDLIDVRDVLWSLLQLARAKWRGAGQRVEPRST